MLSILSNPKSNIPGLTYGNTYTNAFIEITYILKIIEPTSFPNNNLLDVTSINNVPKHSAAEPRVKIIDKASVAISNAIAQPPKLNKTEIPRVKKLQKRNLLTGAHLSTRIDNMHTKIHCQRHGTPIQRSHFTRSCQQEFCIQSIMTVEGYGQYYANHVYHHDTGAK